MDPRSETLQVVRTAFTELVGCKVPIQLAAMGGVGTLELALAVGSAGGLGMVPSSVEVPRDDGKALGQNFLAVFEPSLEAIAQAARHARVVEFFYAWPDRSYVQAVTNAGAIAAWQVGSVEEARAAADAGCGFLIAQGTEAGGHVRGTTALDDLLPAVLGAVSIPVVAAGGIATARRVAQLLTAGAAGVRVGTLFLATPESGAHPIYVERLLKAHAHDTVLTSHFDQGWPNAPHRVLRSSLAAAEESGWRATTPPARFAEGDVEAMAMYAGTGVGSIDAVKAAEKVVSDLCAEL